MSSLFLDFVLINITSSLIWGWRRWYQGYAFYGIHIAAFAIHKVIRNGLYYGSNTLVYVVFTLGNQFGVLFYHTTTLVMKVVFSMHVLFYCRLANLHLLLGANGNLSLCQKLEKLIWALSLPLVDKIFNVAGCWSNFLRLFVEMVSFGRYCGQSCSMTDQEVWLFI